MVNNNGEEKNDGFPEDLFKIFTEDIKGSSKRWSSRNILALQGVRDLILEALHKDYNTIKRLNDELKSK